MPTELEISFSVWEQVIAANPEFPIYYIDQGKSYRVITGHRELIYISQVYGEDKTSFTATYQGNATLVNDEPDAKALIINVNTKAAQRNADGSQVIADRILTLGQEKFKRVDTGSTAMNIDGSTTGTVVNVWNGAGGGADSGADWSTSGVGSETGPAGFGGGGWDTGVTTLDDKTRFDNGSLLDVDGTYAELRFQLQPKLFPLGAKLKLTWRDASGAKVGNTLKVSDYVTDMTLDTWQQVTVPIEDFGLTQNVQQLQFKYTDVGGQQHWIDEIELVENGGGPYRFRFAAPDGYTHYHVSMLVLIVQGPDQFWNSDSFATVAGGLSKGLLVRHRRLSDGEILFGLNSKNNSDLFGRYHPQEDFTFADNVTVVGFMLKPGRASIVVTEDEVLEFVVRDDLSSISDLRAFVHYGVEDVTL